MRHPFRPGHRLRSVEVVDTATSLTERFGPYALVALGWAFPGLGGVLLGWWSSAQVALPFAVGLGIVVAVALRAAWLNERGRRVPKIATVASAPSPPALDAPAATGGRAASKDGLEDARDDTIHRLRKIESRQDDLSQRFDTFQKRMIEVTAALNAERLLLELGRQADELFDRLTQADQDHYESEEHWIRSCWVLSFDPIFGA